MIYEVEFTHVIERKVVCSVEAENEEQAIELAKSDVNWIDSDEDCAPEEGIETKDYKARIDPGSTEVNS